MVFQNYALYPYLTVYENIAFGLRARKAPEAEIKKRVGEAAELLGIGNLHGRYPRQLSGGQRQRVAIGRAIVRKAELFLFDEPLSNLDAQLRDEMRTEIKRLHHEITTTMIYVTHDQVEAMTLADRIVLLRDGKIEQQGAPLELFERPKTEFVARFLGSPSINLIPAKLVAAQGRVAAVFDAGGSVNATDLEGRRTRWSERTCDPARHSSPAFQPRRWRPASRWRRTLSGRRRPHSTDRYANLHHNQDRRRGRDRGTAGT